VGGGVGNVFNFNPQIGCEIWIWRRFERRYNNELGFGGKIGG
jgi:hypothetical protein